MRIGFIAVSGVRVQDADLMALGMTLPGFVERSQVIASLPSLGLLTLAGMTPARHERFYFEVDELDELDALPSDLDLVAISSFTARIRDAYALADRFRAQGVPVALGGLHVTAMPDEAMEHADAVVVGEGEPIWRQLLEDAERGQLQAAYRADGRFDLAESPMPAFEMLDIRRYNRLTVQASRGCPHLCEFCASSVLLTRRYKQKPIPRVLEEIDRICELWKRPFIEFADDNALVNRAYWKELLPELARRRTRWFCETDLSLHNDDELLEMMRESGCAEVLIGFESPTTDGLDGVELNNNWKIRRWPEYVDAVRHIQSHGIRVNGCFVVGMDGHTPDVFDAVFEFVRESELFDVQITVPTPFPGTPLYDRLLRDDRLLEPRAWERCSLFDINFRPDPMSVEELRRGFHDLARRLYNVPETNWRRERFAETYRRASA